MTLSISLDSFSLMNEDLFERWMDQDYELIDEEVKYLSVWDY